MTSTRFWCKNGKQKVINDRAIRCAAYDHIPHSPGVRTCGTCSQHCVLNSDGSVPDHILHPDNIQDVNSIMAVF